MCRMFARDVSLRRAIYTELQLFIRRQRRRKPVELPPFLAPSPLHPRCFPVVSFYLSSALEKLRSFFGHGRRIGTMLGRLSEVVCRPIRIMVCLCSFHLGVARRLIQGWMKELCNVHRGSEATARRMKINTLLWSVLLLFK